MKDTYAMQQDDSRFPMDVTEDDPSSRPWNFRPEGYLVATLADPDEARRAETALVREGFSPGDIKLYTGEQILENHELYMGRRTAVSKAVGAVADDVEGLRQYLAYAREGRCGMWVRIPNEDHVAKALRVLADFSYLHARYYGHDEQHDFHVT
jgi:hypothetical protein